MTTVAREPNAGRLLVGRLGGVAASLAAGQVLIGLTYVVAARGIGPAGLGLVATCFALGSIGATVFDAGLIGYLVREVAADRVTLARGRAWCSAKRRAVPLLLVPDVVACVLIAPGLVEGLVLGLVGWAVWEAQTANALLRSQERFSRAAWAQLAGRATGLVVTVVLVVAGAPELGLAIGLVASFVVEAGLDRVFLGRAPEAAAGFGETLAVHRRSLSFGVVSLAAIGQQLDTPLATAGGGATVGGIYAGAGRLLGPLLFLSSSLALVGAPWLARAGKDPEALRREERRIGLLSLALTLGPLVAALIGPLLIPWILGDEFADSGPTFAVLAVGAAFSTVNQGMATVLQNRGAERAVGTAVGIGLCLGLVVTYVLAAVAGPVEAAAGFTLSQLYILGHLLVAKRRTALPAAVSTSGR
ncbi:lipopolysaccharide biosynthesis protein [Blastococcus sp. SYSU D00813]